MTINPFDCTHPATAIRFRTRSNGVDACVLQCLRCGRELRSIGKNAPERRALVTREAFDEALFNRVYTEHRAATEAQWAAAQAARRAAWETEQEAREQERAAHDAEWWRRYNAYLRSDAWQEKRLRVFERDNYLCQACRGRRATQVHHLTYAHVFREPLFDLVAICTVCHEALHETSIEEAA